MLAITFDCDIKKEDAENIEKILSERLGEKCKFVPMATGIYRITPRISLDILKQTAEKLKESSKVFDQETKEKRQKRGNDRELVLHALLPFCFGFLAARLLKHQ